MVAMEQYWKNLSIENDKICKKVFKDEKKILYDNKEGAQSYFHGIRLTVGEKREISISRILPLEQQQVFENNGVQRHVSLLSRNEIISCTFVGYSKRGRPLFKEIDCETLWSVEQFQTNWFLVEMDSVTEEKLFPCWMCRNYPERDRYNPLFKCFSGFSLDYQTSFKNDNSDLFDLLSNLRLLPIQNLVRNKSKCD